jgi:DDE family transposase
MTACTRSALALLTDFFSSDDIEATARRTGFVKRASKITGKLFLALVTFGSWSNAQTTLAQLAAKVTQVVEHVEVSPEAIHQRMNKRALVFLQDIIRQALAKVQALEKVCADGLFTAFTKGYLADSTGFGLPDSLSDLFPGSGGSATKAGAKIQAVWDYKSSVFGHFALTPWNIPDQKYVDTVVALAQQGVLFIFDLGYFKLKAFARIVEAGAYFLSRLNHQTTIFDADTGGLQPLELAAFLNTVESNRTEKAILLGAKERVASRLVAYRLPEPIVNARRRIAKKNAKKKGYTPSQAHLALLAWNLFITNVPRTIWKTETVGKVYPIRWQVELIFKSWKSYLH